MSSRWKKVWADFWGNKTRTVLTVLAILVGTAGVGFVNNLNLYMLQSMDSDFLSASPSEAKVYAYGMNDDSVKIAREVPGIEAVEGTALYSGQVLRPDGSKVAIQFTSVKNPNELTLNTLQPVKGETGIASLGFREALVDSGAATLGYKPGDLITVEVGNRKLRDVRLAGYVHAAAAWPYVQTKTVDAYVTPRTMEWLGGNLDYDTLAISVTEHPTDEKHVTQVAQAVQKRLEQSGLTVAGIFVFRPGHHYAYSISQSIFLIMNLLGWLVVLLSVFLIVNTINALMSQQTRQIGIMKSTGGSTSQILGMYLVLVLSFGLIALLIAIPIANREAEKIGLGMAKYLGFYISPYHGYSATLIQQIIIALVVPLLAALWPVYNSVRITVREALTDYGIRGSAKPSRKSVRRVNLLFPRPMRLSLRNTFRRKGRLSLTLFTLVLAGAVFISVFNLRASFYKVIDELSGYYLADVIINFNRLYRLDQIAPLAESVPGVEGAEGWLETSGTLVRGDDKSETQVYLVAPPSSSKLIKPIVIAGRKIEKGDENAIAVSNYLVQMFPDLKVGDQLTIKINERETKWKIVGVYSMTSTGGSPVLYVNNDYFSQLIGQPGHAFSLRITTSGHDLTTQKAVEKQLQSVYAEHGIPVAGSMLGAEQIQDTKSTFDIFIYFFLVMSTLIAVIGGLGLTSTMSINVMERTREIGVMRAIGASSWNIQSIVIVEGMIICLISWIISLLISVLLTNVMTSGVGLLIFGKPLTVVYGWDGIFFWLLGILGIGILASALPARGASRLTVKDTLAYE
jgi:putative ABC transport system permease protein